MPSLLDPKTAAPDTTTLAPLLAELMTVLKPGLPTPEIKLMNRKGHTLGETLWRYGKRGGEDYCDDNTVISIQQRLLEHPEGLKKILAHELAHHEDFLVNDAPKFRELGYETFQMLKGFDRSGGHGAAWQAIAARFNAKYGKDFVTRTSDQDFRVETMAKPFFVLMQIYVGGQKMWQQGSRLSPKQKELLVRRKAEGAEEGAKYPFRLFMSTDPEFLKGPLISAYNGWALPRTPEQIEKYDTLWNEGEDILDRTVQGIIGEMPGKKAKTEPQTALQVASLFAKTGGVPEDLATHAVPVNKEFDQVRRVYQWFMDHSLETMPWSKFQKQFPFAQNSPLFNRIRGGKPAITTDDLWAFLDNAYERNEAGFGVSYDRYRNAEHSYRDVEQLVLQINQGAVADRILDADPLLKRYVDMVRQSSGMSGHPSGEDTIGWLRVDFINQDYLLIDEVQSDLVNSVTQAEMIVRARNFAEFMEGIHSEKMREMIAQRGLDQRQYNNVRRQFVGSGFTAEKLGEIRQKLVGLSKEWAEYALATLIDIARRHGIRQVAIHSAQSIASRDDGVDANKLKMYYDNLARSFGFREETLDEESLKGKFWVRTASKAKLMLIARPTESKIEMLKRQFRLDDQQIEACIATDPSPNQSDCMIWLAKWLSKGSIRLPEDSERIKAQLETFLKLKRSPGFEGNKDLNTYDPGTLSDVIEANSLNFSKKEQDRQIVMKGADVVVEQDGIRVYKVTDVRAEMKLSGGTNWCTAHESNATYYLTKGPLYPIFENGHAYAQLHPGSNQLMDRRDISMVEQVREDRGYYYRSTSSSTLHFVWDTTVRTALDLLAKKEPEVRKWMNDHLSSIKDVKAALNKSGASPENMIKFALLTNKPLTAKQEASLGKQDRSEVGSYAIKHNHVPVDLILKYASKFHPNQRWEPLEQALINNKVTEELVSYCTKFIKQRWPDGEKKILTRCITSRGAARIALDYAQRVIKGRWPEFEKKIAKAKPSEMMSEIIYSYADNVIKGTWDNPEIEKSMILGDPAMAMTYCAKFVKGPWPLFVETLTHLPTSVTKDRRDAWKEESYQTRAGAALVDYASRTLKSRDAAIEDALLHGRSTKNCERYATQVIKDRWPEYESLMLEHIKKENARGHMSSSGFKPTRRTDKTESLSYGRGEWTSRRNALPEAEERYVCEIVKGRWPELEEVLLDRYKSPDTYRDWEVNQQLIDGYLNLLVEFGETWPEGVERLDARDPAYERRLLKEAWEGKNWYSGDDIVPYYKLLRDRGESWPEGLAAARYVDKRYRDYWRKGEDNSRVMDSGSPLNKAGLGDLIDDSQVPDTAAALARA